MKIEDVDGVYKIYSWICSSCGQSVDMAVASVDALLLPDYCLMMETDDVAAPPAHVIAAKPARTPARRAVVAA